MPESTVPTRSSVSTSAPKRSNAGRPRTDYSAWEPVVKELRDAVGEWWNYEGVAKVDTLAAGLRDTFGILVKTSDVDRKRNDDGTPANETYGMGTLSIAYPTKQDAKGNTVPNPAYCDAEIAKRAAKRNK